MQPMRDLIVLEVQPEPKETKKGGLFYSAPKWAEPTNIGKVLQKGPQATDVELDKYYLFNPYAVIDTKEDTIKLIKQSDILCQLDDPKE